MHRVFVSYHHINDQCYKDMLVKWADDILLQLYLLVLKPEIVNM